MNQFRQRSQYVTPPAVLNLLIINGLFFMAMKIVPGAGDWLVNNLALYFWQSPYFQPWQPVTYMFLHGSFEHLFFNMFALWMFGRVAEMDMGTRRFLLYYFATGVGAALIQMLVIWAFGSPLEYSVPTVGASGAVFGLLLSFGMMHPNSMIMLLFPPIPMKAKWFVIGYGVLELFFGISGYQQNVAHFAHVGGMIFGFLLLRYWKRTGKIYY
ncbi:MAG: rhomboid family intramembrane serine protease [Rikenellaceae bacterium]|jgi:membrane associated rhomboid family serine protease|nr:rhomboid family intramembrane serine protease [Rikenellaceae bacterium]